MPKIPTGIWAIASHLKTLAAVDQFVTSASAADCWSLRRPRFSTQDTLTAIQKMSQHKPLFTHAMADWAELGASGVICGAHSLPPATVKKIYPQLAVGASVHNDHEIDAALDADVDFLVYGPIWDTPSKQDFLSARGLEQLEAVVKRSVKVIAIGGVQTADQVKQLKQCGVHGVAVLRAAQDAQLLRELSQAFNCS